MYRLLRQALFQLSPETAHHFSLSAMDCLAPAGLLRWARRPVPACPVQAFGLTFPNPVGLAAGLDKNGAHIDALAQLGFGFLEIGTVTPRPQPGNPMPRMFRLPQHRAIINRMGFNNLGVDVLVENVKKSSYRGILGINIGKNFDTPMEQAAEDYLIGLRKVYAHASYVAVNISSPNTKNLRQLQEADALDQLLGQLKREQQTLAATYGKHVPLLLKIAPDLDDEQIVAIADLLRRHQFEGVIATNTTLSREGVEGHAHSQEAGGLSGAPVRDRSTQVQAKLHQALAGAIPVVGVGGIMSGADAQAKQAAGATLVQLYTGFIYGGPGLIRECVKAWACP